MLGCHHPPGTMFRADEFDPFARTTKDGLAVVVPMAMVGASHLDPFSVGHTRVHPVLLHLLTVFGLSLSLSWAEAIKHLFKAITLQRSSVNAQISGSFHAEVRSVMVSPGARTTSSGPDGSVGLCATDPSSVRLSCSEIGAGSVGSAVHPANDAIA